MALNHQLDNPRQNASPSTFHEAIQHFMRPQNPNAKPSLPTFKRRGKKRDAKLKKSEFELSKESSKPTEEELSPRRFDGSTMSLQFKSPTVFLEVKLAEMLSKEFPSCEKPSPPGKYNEVPNAYRTSICCQIMSDMCQMSSPFAKVLPTIQHVLEMAIYSNYVTPSTTSAFDQVPYFDLVSSLERKNDESMKEENDLKTLLLERHADIDRINVHVQDLKLQLNKESESVLSLQTSLAASIRALEKSNKEITRLTDQVAKSRLEVLHAREVEHQLEEADARYESLMGKHLSIIHELQHIQSNLEVARKEAADGVPKKEMATAKAHIKELQHKLMKTEILTEQMDTMTPRPHWALLRGGSFYVMSTAAQAAEICKLNDLLLENVTTLRLECATAQVSLAEMKQQKKAGRYPNLAPTSSTKSSTEITRPKSS